MAAITGLGPHGSMKSHGTFSAKSPSSPVNPPAPKITSLGLHGSMRAYSTFTAKAPSGGSGGTSTGGFWIFGDSVIS